MITPLGLEGGFHVTVSCVTVVVADRLDTGPGTVYNHACRVVYTCSEYFMYICHLYRLHSPSCSVSTVNAGSLYGPVPPSLTAANCTE